MSGALATFRPKGNEASLIFPLLLALTLVGCRQIQDIAQNTYAEPGPRIYGDHTVGQTFVAHHDNLKQVDVMLATYARLQIHPVVFVLKESPTATDELARVTAGPLTVQDNVFHPFSFAPIPNSAGQAYYFEIQSPEAPEERPVTVWYQPSDVYSEGKGYVSGQPVAEADVAFRAYYDSGSLSAAAGYIWSRLPDKKPGIWGKNFPYGIAIVLYGVLLFGVFFSLVRLTWCSKGTDSSAQVPGGPVHRRDWLLFLLLALALVQGVVYASVTYPWQVPDEHGHFEYARLMAEQKRVPSPKNISQSLQQEVLASMYVFDFWRLAGQATPVELPPHFTADPYLQPSRPQVGDEPPLYYLLPAAGYLFTRDKSVETQLYAMRITSILFIVVTVWISYLVTRELFSENRLLVIAIPTLVALLPMFSYIGAGVNNDVAAAAFASWVFLLLTRLFTRDVNWYRAMWLFVAVGLALMVKKTNLFLIPSILVAATVYMLPRLKYCPRIRYLVFIILVLVSVFSLLLTALSRVSTGDVWAWQERPRPWMQTQSNAYRKTGSFSIHLKDDSADWTRKLVQTIRPRQMSLIAGQPVTLSAWVRSESGEQPGMLVIRDSEAETATTFVASPHWSYFSVSHIIDPQAASVDLLLVAGSDAPESRSDLYFDDLALFAEPVGDAQTNNLLQNSSAETSGNLASALPEYLRVYFGIPMDMGRRLLDARYYTFPQARFYVRSLRYAFDSFWARFAQQAYVVSFGWYLLWGIVTLLAIIGILVRLARRKWHCVGEASKSQVLLVFGTALIFIMTQTFLPAMRLRWDWMPQGRYTFPAIVPTSIFLVLGTRQLLPVRLKDIGVLLLVALVAFFNITVLLNYIIPYFYG